MYVLDTKRNVILFARPPQCMWDALDTTGLSTMHHYFWDYPLLIVCPLKYEKTVRGYRDLMASILEK